MNQKLETSCFVVPPRNDPKPFEPFEPLEPLKLLKHGTRYKEPEKKHKF